MHYHDCLTSWELLLHKVCSLLPVRRRKDCAQGCPPRDKLGLYRDNRTENGNYRDYWGYIGIMEQKMETIGIIGVYTGKMEQKMENMGIIEVIYG